MVLSRSVNPPVYVHGPVVEDPGVSGKNKTGDVAAMFDAPSLGICPRAKH